MRPSTVRSQSRLVEKVSVAGKNGLLTDCERSVPENESFGAEDPLPELQVGAADDAAGDAAGREVEGSLRVNDARRS